MILKHVGITNKTVHYLRHGFIPDQLLAAMRVMAMNPAEVDFCYGLADQEEDAFKDSALTTSTTVGSVTVAKVLEFVSVRNEVAMLDLLDTLMRSKLQGILECDAILSVPQNQAQEFARIYRDGKDWDGNRHRDSSGLSISLNSLVFLLLLGQRQILDSCSDLARGMMSKLLQEVTSGQLDLKQAMFMDVSDSSTSSRRLLPMDDYTFSYFKESAARETRTMSELKKEVVSQLLLTAKGVMLEERDQIFGEAFMAAFPDHGWGESESGEQDPELGEEEEMAIQMEQDAILTCFLVMQRHSSSQRSRFIEAAKTVDYSR